MIFCLARTHIRTLNFRPHAHRTHVCILSKFESHTHTHVCVFSLCFAKIRTRTFFLLHLQSFGILFIYLCSGFDTLYKFGRVFAFFFSLKAFTYYIRLGTLCEGMTSFGFEHFYKICHFLFNKVASERREKLRKIFSSPR